MFIFVQKESTVILVIGFSSTKGNFGALGQIPVFYSTKEQKELSFNYLVVKYLMAKNLKIL